MPKKKKASPLLSERHEAALEEYEKGIRLLQQKDYSKAVPRFRTVIEEYPNEAALGGGIYAYQTMVALVDGGLRENVAYGMDFEQNVAAVLPGRHRFHNLTGHLRRTGGGGRDLGESTPQLVL